MTIGYFCNNCNIKLKRIETEEYECSECGDIFDPKYDDKHKAIVRDTN